MAVTNFRTLKADLVDRNILNTDLFAEEVTFTPLSTGTERTIGVKFSATIENEELFQRFRVKVRRDATLGIDAPQVGDRLLRSAENDPDERYYLATRETPEMTGTHWVVEFTRNKPGASASYALPAGESTPLQVTLGPESTSPRDAQGVQAAIHSRLCSWHTMDQETINRRAKIIVDGEEWSIADIVSKDAARVVVQLNRHELTERTRPNYRGP